MVRPLLVFGVAFLVIVAYQWLSGAYRDDFYYEDSAGHFVTGAMVADYLRNAPGTDPMAFAENYYLRSPKVAFGRWPPLFHLIQGAWYLAFGVSKVSALTLIAVISAATLTCLFGRLTQLYGQAVATLSLVPLAAQPLLRWQARNIMSDTLTLLFCMLATFAFADFLGSRNRRKLAASVAWCVAAAATKENAYYLLLFLPLAIATNGGWSVRRDLRLWASVGVMAGAAVGIAAYRLSNGAGLHGYQQVGELLTRMVHANSVRELVAALLGIAQPLTFVVALGGLLASARGGASLDVLMHLRLSATWIASMLLFFWVAPVPPQSRYFLPAFVPLTLLVANALHACRAYLAQLPTAAAQFTPVALCLTLTLIAARPTPVGVCGFDVAARAIPIRQNEVTLISSTSFGEGAFIVARLMSDREQLGIVLRGSKALSDSDWLGNGFQLLLKDADEVYRYLRDVPVHYVAVDSTFVADESELADQKLLRQAIEEHPDAFELVGSFPLQRGDKQFADAVKIYRNAEAARRRSELVRIDLRHTLGRVLEFRLHPQSSVTPSTP